MLKFGGNISGCPRIFNDSAWGHTYYERPDLAEVASLFCLI